MEESDYCEELDAKVHDPPLCEFFLTFPGKTGVTEVVISERLKVPDLMKKISNHLRVPVDRIVLKNSHGGEVRQDSVSLATFHCI